jgi:hypothetical protein
MLYLTISEPEIEVIYICKEVKYAINIMIKYL